MCLFSQFIYLFIFVDNVNASTELQEICVSVIKMVIMLLIITFFVDLKNLTLILRQPLKCTVTINFIINF